jgi:hypothetical protein
VKDISAVNTIKLYQKYFQSKWFKTFMQLINQCSGSWSICFGPPGSGFISQRPGSRSFSQQSKKFKNTLNPTVFFTSFVLFIFEKWCKCIFQK